MVANVLGRKANALDVAKRLIVMCVVEFVVVAVSF